MSLINNMLKDLERREQQRIMPHVVPSIVPKKNRFAVLYDKPWLPAIGLFTFTIIATMLFSHSAPPARLATFVAEDNSVNATRVVDESKWLNPALITGISLQVKDNVTEISFLLDHLPLYRLVNHMSRNELSIIIDHAHLQSELPAINYLNSAMQHISVQQIHNDLKFTLLLVPDTAIKYVNLNEDDKNPALVVGIEYLPKEMASADNASEAIKIPVMRSLLTQQYQDALKEAESGQYQSAIEHFSSLLKIDPTYKEVRVSLAALLLDQGYKLKDAEKIIDEGLHLSPDWIPFVELKARILTAQGNTQKALSMLQTVSPSIHDNPDYHAFVAALYEQTNDALSASNIYRQLLTLNPHNGNWWFGLGLSLEKLGQKTSAMEAYSKAIAEGHLNSKSITYLHNRLYALEKADHDQT